MPYSVFGFDLLDEINSKIQKLTNPALSDEYMSRAYSPDFSKDPFGDAMANKIDQYNKPRLAGVQRVKQSLEAEGCPMSNKKIYGILYRYVTGFKENLVRDMKIELGDYDATKYELDDETVIGYCRDFYECHQRGNKKLKCIERNGILGKCTRRADPADLKSSCEKFFRETYFEGEYNEQNKQNVQVSQMSTDRYWNETTDDSPYDIMDDFGELSKLLYFDAQDPISPVFYHMPNFSNSEKALYNGSISSESTIPSDGEGNYGATVFGDGSEEDKGDEEGDKGDKEDDTENQRNEGDTGGSEDPSAPISPIVPSEMSDYDDLFEGLGAYSLTSDGSEFYTNLCDNREQQEGNGENISDIEENVNLNDEFFDDLPEEEYQKIIDYMLDAVDDYSSLPSGKNDEIEKKSGNKGDFLGESSPEDIEKRTEEVKKCYDSCKGLRVDQKASCMVKCSCGEISSELFDPNEFPGLGPILVIKYCAVPAVATKFSAGGKRIHSIEEGLKEIYGVVDKLSREGKLGKWTQQYEFLDSSTKRMNFADTFAFTIDVEFVDIANKMPKHSEQYEKKELKNENVSVQDQLIGNPLDTSAGGNAYGVVGNISVISEQNVGDSKNPKKTDAVLSELNENFQTFVDVFEDAGADLRVNLEKQLELWISQQLVLWKNTEVYIGDLIDSATKLSEKGKCN